MEGDCRSCYMYLGLAISFEGVSFEMEVTNTIDLNLLYNLNLYDD